MSVTSRQSSAR